MPLSAESFVESNRQRLLEELCEFLRIPSVSTLPEHKPDIERAAKFVAASLTATGLENAEIIPTDGHPLVYADWLEERDDSRGPLLRKFVNAFRSKKKHFEVREAFRP